MDEELIKRLNEHMGRPVFMEGKCSVEEEKLPFYDGVSLFTAKTFSTVPVVTRRFVGDNDVLITLDGTEDSLEEINENFKLHLTDAVVLDYLDFYLSAVMVQKGTFRLIRTPEALGLTVPETDELVAVMKKLIDAPVVKKEGNAFFVKAYLLLGTTLYLADLSVLADGDVEMTAAELTYENLPVPVERPVR